MALQYAYPDQDDTSDDNWRDKDGGTTLYTSIADVQGSPDDAATFIQSIDDQSSNQVCIVSLSDVSAPGSSGTYIKYTALTEDASYGGPPSLKLELLQGGSVLSPAVTVTNSSVSTSGFESYIYEVLNVSGISDWADLQMRITMVSNAGMSDPMKVTQVYLETQAASVEGGSSTHPTRKFVKISSYIPTKPCTLSPVFGV